MPILSAGVSNGAAVTNQNTGVSLVVANDYGHIIISNAAPPEGPDTAGGFTISGTYGINAVVAFEKVVSKADFDVANWTPLYGMILKSTGASLPTNGYTTTLLANATADFAIPSVQGWYAVRARLVTIPASGSVVISGSTFAVVSGAPSPAVLAAFQQLALLGTAQVMALNDIAGPNVDYFSAVGLAPSL